MRYPTVTIRIDVLESWLKVSGYTKSRLATELGVSRGRISQLISTQREPSAHLIAKLLTVTNLPFDWIFRVIRSDVRALSSIPRTTKTASKPTGKAPSAELAEEPVETQLAGGEPSS